MDLHYIYAGNWNLGLSPRFLGFNGDIIIILNISKIGEKEDISKIALADFLNQDSLSCGISMCFSDLLHIQSYYIQAKSAYEIGSKRGGDPLYHFQDSRSII